MAITQASHGFSVKQGIYFNGTIWALSRGDAAATGRTIAVVESVADVNTFTAVMGGLLTTTGLTAGAYYASAVTAGLLTQTAPTADGHFKQPVMIAVSATAAYVLGYPLEPTAPTGSFTPAITFGGLSVGVTYTDQIGRYTVISDRVFFNIWLNISDKGSSTGSALVTGLPIAANVLSQEFHAFALRLSGVTYASDCGAYVAPGDTEVNLNGISAAGVLNTLDDIAFATASTVMLSGHYRI